MSIMKFNNNSSWMIHCNVSTHLSLVLDLLRRIYGVQNPVWRIQPRCFCFAELVFSAVTVYIKSGLRILQVYKDLHCDIIMILFCNFNSCFLVYPVNFAFELSSRPHSESLPSWIWAEFRHCLLASVLSPSMQFPCPAQSPESWVPASQPGKTLQRQAPQEPSGISFYSQLQINW